MLILLKLNNNEKKCYTELRYWIIDHCKKWILFKNSPTILGILEVNSYSRIDYVQKILKGIVLKARVAKSKLEKDILKTKQLNCDDDLIKVLRQYFFTLDAIDEATSFNNMEFKGYTKKSLIKLLEKPSNISDNNTNTNNNPIISNFNINNSNVSKKVKEENKTKNLIYKNKKVCNYCSKEFSTSFNTKRHEKTCLLNIKDEKKSYGITNNINNNHFQYEMDYVKNELKKIAEMVSVKKDNVVNNNNINVQINNNYSEKRNNLNKYFKYDIDIESFLDKFKNDPRFHLSNDESETLLYNSEELGPISFGHGLYTYLKKKYCLQLKDLTGQDTDYKDCILPFVNSDINYRTHYELTKDGWVTTSSKDNLLKILNITDNQIFKNCNQFVYYSKKKGKTHVMNILLNKSDYSKIDFNKISKVIISTNDTK